MVLISAERQRRDEGSGVSVPLRGLWFLSKQWNKGISNREPVSVPLRGLWFLSLHTSARNVAQP